MSFSSPSSANRLPADTPSVLSPGVESPANSTGPAVCESCAREDDDLVAVRRVYLSEGEPTVLPQVELWCFACRTMYPHEEVDA